MHSSRASFKIGEISRRTGVGIHTLRYYEKRGLLPKSRRTEGGFRLYDADVPERLAFIRQAQAFGLTLEEIRKIIVCGQKGLEPCCDMVGGIYNQKLEEFESKIRMLQQMRKKLKTSLGRWVRSKGK